MRRRQRACVHTVVYTTCATNGRGVRCKQVTQDINVASRSRYYSLYLSPHMRYRVERAASYRVCARRLCMLQRVIHNRLFIVLPYLLRSVSRLFLRNWLWVLSLLFLCQLPRGIEHVLLPAQNNFDVLSSTCRLAGCFVLLFGVFFPALALGGKLGQRLL